MISVPFSVGARIAATVPLQDQATGVAVTDDAGAVVTVDLRWPDHPCVARERLSWLAHQAAVLRAEQAPGGLESLTPPALVELLVPRDEALLAYGTALVIGWSVADPCTPDRVRAFFTSTPFALGVVLAASGDADRFLPASLRRSTSTSQPASEAVVG